MYCFPLFFFRPFLLTPAVKVHFTAAKLREVSTSRPFEKKDDFLQVFNHFLGRIGKLP